VLPAVPPLSAAAATRWVRAGVPRWVTGIVLPALWLVAVAVAIANDTTRCTPQDPSVCGPDSTFAFAFVVLLAIPVLLWWMPVFGCAAAVLFALADVRYDNIAAAKWAFGLHGLLCALVGWRLLHATAEQRRIAAAAAGSGQLAAPAGPPVGGPRGVGRWLVAGVLVLAGLGFFALYLHLVSDEQAHLRRAVRVPARVVEVQVDDSVTVSAHTPLDGTKEYRIGVYDSTGPYPLHSSTPVLLDPRDPGWIRLVAEPQDVTYWQSAGAGCWLLALLWLLFRGRWYRGLHALETAEHPALRVRIRPDGKGRALILPAAGSGADADRPIGRLAVMAAPPPATGHSMDWQSDEPDGWNSDEWRPDGWRPEGWDSGNGWENEDGWDPETDWDHEDGWDHETQEAFGRTWRDEDPTGRERFAPPATGEDAVLVGELCDRGVAMLVTAEQKLLPTGRLRVGLDTGWPRGSSRPATPDPYSTPGAHGPGQQPSGWWQRLRAARTPAEPELFAGIAVQPSSGQLPDLPVTVRPRVRNRLIGAAMLLAAFAGYPAAVGWGEVDLYPHVVIALGLGRLATAGSIRLLSYLRIDHARFEISGLWWAYSVPWDRLHGVRRDGDQLSVAWQPDVIIEVGPFDDPDGPRGRQQRAERLGGTMLLLRQRALLGGLPSRRVSRRLSPTWIVLAAYGVLVLLSFWWR